MITTEPPSLAPVIWACVTVFASRGENQQPLEIALLAADWEGRELAFCSKTVRPRDLFWDGQLSPSQKQWLIDCGLMADVQSASRLSDVEEDLIRFVDCHTISRPTLAGRGLPDVVWVLQNKLPQLLGRLGPKIFELGTIVEPPFQLSKPEERIAPPRASIEVRKQLNLYVQAREKFEDLQLLETQNNNLQELLKVADKRQATLLEHLSEQKRVFAEQSKELGLAQERYRQVQLDTKSLRSEAATAQREFKEMMTLAAQSGEEYAKLEAAHKELQMVVKKLERRAELAEADRDRFQMDKDDLLQRVDELETEP